MISLIGKWSRLSSIKISCQSGRLHQRTEKSDSGMVWDGLYFDKTIVLPEKLFPRAKLVRTEFVIQKDGSETHTSKNTV